MMMEFINMFDKFINDRVAKAVEEQAKIHERDAERIATLERRLSQIDTDLTILSSPMIASPDEGVMNESNPDTPPPSLGGGAGFVWPRTPNEPPVTLSLLKFIAPLILLSVVLPIADEESV
tara:strand:+ start:746 stop:1108 length:363 start_codon:yes stop_codon:yes gene_type:complete